MIIEEQIKALIGEQRYIECVDLLIEHTGEGKTIDPNNTKDMEDKFYLLLNHLRKNRDYKLLHISAHKLKKHLKKLEEIGGTHYHKGLLYHNLGIALHKFSLGCFLSAFIEDAINNKEPLPLKPARQHLEGLFKANNEDLEKLGEYAIKSCKNTPDTCNDILKKFIKDSREPFIELWRIEYEVSLLEKEIRKCIDETLPSNWWNETKHFKEKVKIEAYREKEKELLGRASSDSLIDYLSITEYIRIVKDNETLFKPKIGDVDEFSNKMKIVEYIRNKVAHTRKVYKEDTEKLEETRKWLGKKIANCQEVDVIQLPSQYLDSSAHAISGNIYIMEGFHSG